MKYDVIVTYAASTCITVEADNPEEAKHKALDEAGPLSICHQCARRIDIGDPIEATEAIESK